MFQAVDYKDIGLIAGLEVHQQLLTTRKMFCHCPAGLYTNSHDGEVLRHMRPTLSELGEYDGTALMEFKTKKNIIYLLHKDNVCTYEMDDTPPFLINQQALDVAIEQCLMLGCDIVDEVHVTRKQYLDGSIPTGFQRTAIVGVNGKLQINNRDLNIIQVSIEEDSCREVYDKGHLIVWRTDRLGMPLIETVTAPELQTPEEVQQAILLIGRVCRSTGHVRVGSGASRQDINVSVRGGRRVEIKGVPSAKWASLLVHGEAIRQVNLLKLRDELWKMGFKKPEDLDITHQDVTSFFENSRQPILHREHWEMCVREHGRRPQFELGEGPFCVQALKLKGLRRTLNWPTQPDHIFAHELAGRIRVIAGLDQQPILVHSEKWPDYGDSQKELRKLKRHLSCNPEDGIIVIWGPRQDTLTAVEEIRLRYKDALDGVPHETRQPFEDGSTDFERILPGPDRMYPDTDSPPIRIIRKRVENLAGKLPPPPWEREKRYQAVGVPSHTIHYLIRKNKASLVDYVTKGSKIDLRRACFLFGEQLKGMGRKGIAVENIDRDTWCLLFDHIESKPALWDLSYQIISQLTESPDKDIPEILSHFEPDTIKDNWESSLVHIVGSFSPTSIKQRNNRECLLEKFSRFYMGLVMKDLRGHIPAQQIRIKLDEILKEKLGQ